MKIHIVAGGPKSFIPDLSSYKTEDIIWIGVDRGVFYLLSEGIKPIRAFGDFDSVTPEEWTEIQNSVPELDKFQPEKDETDLELALNWALTQNPKSISIFGATGGRLDHFMANVQLLVMPIQTKKDVPIHIIDNNNVLFVKKPGIYTVEKMDRFKYISFLPVTPSVSGLTLENFKYTLKECHIPMGSTLCISNELINDHGTFSFSEGILLVVRSND